MVDFLLGGAPTQQHHPRDPLVIGPKATKNAQKQKVVARHDEESKLQQVSIDD
jgi:hypothetical protein